MAIFSRRVIQRELDSLRPYILKPEEEKDVIRRLNGRRRQAINAEWEVVLVGAFSRIGEVDYAKPFGSKRPDLFVRTKHDEQSLEFLADIVTVCDEEITKRNPADYFFSQFDRVAAKFRLTNGGFDARIGSDVFGKYPDKRQQLQLPPKNDIVDFIEQECRPFFEEVRLQPLAKRELSIKRSGIDLSVSYDPAQLGHSTGNYAFCGSPFSLRRNPLFGALNEKASTLRQSGYTGLKGIIVADGDCGALRSSRGGTAWSRDQIVEEFLRMHPYVGFVTTTHYENRNSWTKTEHTLSHKIYFQRPFDESVTSKLYPVINTALKTLPPVSQSPHNAWLNVRSGHDILNGRRLGACNGWNSRRLGYSARTFLGLIAGTLTHHEFTLLILDMYPGGGPFFQFFANLYKSKEKVARVAIEPGEPDDDFIVFDLNKTEDSEAPQSTNPVSAIWCDLPTEALVYYFALLAYEVRSKRTKFSTGVLPVDVQGYVRNRMWEGRTLIAAALRDGGQTFRLFFGERDSAVSEYF